MGDSNSPPSFDAIFSSQEPPRRSSSNSSSFNAYSYGNPSKYPVEHNQHAQIVDEPQSLHRRLSNASMQGQGQGGRDRASSSASVTDMTARGFNMEAGPKSTFNRRQSSSRNDSLPFNPEADSTLIATAPRQGNTVRSHVGQGLTSPPIGDIMFGSQQRNRGVPSEQQQVQQQHQQLYQSQPQQVIQHQTQWTGQLANDGVLQQQQQQQQQQQSQQSHYPHTQGQAQFSPFHSPMPTPSSAGLDYMTPGTAISVAESSIYDQYSPYTNPALTPNTQNAGPWGQEFTGQTDCSSGYGGQESQPGALEDLMGMNEQDALNNELQRILSNTSHHSSHSHGPSREPSPYSQSQSVSSSNQQSYPIQHSVPASAGHSRQGSFPTSRSPSPFAQPQYQHQQQQQDMSHITSPPVNGSFIRAGSSSQAGSPFINKPQSPPALIIPNQHSPSPVLPQIVTVATGGGPSTNSSAGVVPRQGDLGGAVSGGLLPPTNPALEHLTGMAGISPIGPSADGPMIYIQPSTPISGLKDGRGLFDAALRRAGAMAQQGGQNNHHVQDSQGQQQQQGFNVPPLQSGPLSRPASSDQLTQAGQNNPSNHSHSQAQMDFAAAMAFQASQGWGQQAVDSLRIGTQSRPRAKSDSFMPSPTADSFDRQALFNLLAGPNPTNGDFMNAMQEQGVSEQWRNAVNAWRTNLDEGDQNGLQNASIDPRMLPGQDGQNQAQLQQFMQQTQQLPHNFETSQAHQLNQLQAQRNRLPPLNTDTNANANTSGEQGQAAGVFKYEPGEFSPTSMAFYQSIGLYPHSASELHGTTSAPFFTTTFGDISGTGVYPNAVGSGPSYLMPNQSNIAAGLSGGASGTARRRSFGGEGVHPAAGAGTPGYGVEFTSNPSPFGSVRPGQVRSVSGHGHRRAAKSEDFGRVGTGWGVGAGGSTADFLQSITANDGSLLPPSNRGRTMSHSRHSSASSIRSASPALSISSQGSSFSHQSPRMDMPEGMQVPTLPGGDVLLSHTQAAAGGRKKRVAKMKVTSVATEMASTSRRTNSGVFKCPVPGCGSTFTRHFNLKGHLRSHNDERPYKCLYDGCPKAVIGFARQHDCKRHMLLHEGLRPFECEGCGKKFARLDALTRHHKSEQGQECAITHPLPVNPDGTPMSESQYKAYRGIKAPTPTPSPGKAGPEGGGNGGGNGGRRGSDVKQEFMSGDDRSGEEDGGADYNYAYQDNSLDMEMDLGGGMGGMEDYDRF